MSNIYSPQRIYLVGMMGVGKSTLGKQLAKKLKASFIDLDIEIEHYAQQSISVIFEQKGEEYFRLLEQTVLKETKNRDHIIVATGGGTACFNKNMEWMKAQGKTIYLKATASFIVSRISTNPDKRPLLMGKSLESIKLYIDELLTQRTPYYEQAESTVNVPIESMSVLVKSTN